MGPLYAVWRFEIEELGRHVGLAGIINQYLAKIRFGKNEKSSVRELTESALLRAQRYGEGAGVLINRGVEGAGCLSSTPSWFF